MPSASDVAFGKLAVTRGACAPEVVERCLAIQVDQERSLRRPVSLDRVLFEHGHLVVEQLRALQQEQGRQVSLCPVCLMKINIAGIPVAARVVCPTCRQRRVVPIGLFPEFLLARVEGDAAGAAGPMEEGGGRLGQFRLLCELGRGSAGIVYQARHVATREVVALKVLAHDVVAHTKARKRFLREAQVGLRLRHENLVRTLEVGETDGTHWISLEFVDGRNLRQILARDGALAPLRALGYALQTARALEYVHSLGIVHRDIKPANLLVRADEQLKVSDLGLAKTYREAPTTLVTAEGIGAGTPVYVAPEQILDARSADHRADVYALGTTLFHAVTGTLPFASRTSLAAAAKLLDEELPSPRAVVGSLPESLCAAILAMTRKAPQDRYPSMTEVRAALEKIQAELA